MLLETEKVKIAKKKKLIVLGSLLQYSLFDLYKLKLKIPFRILNQTSIQTQRKTSQLHVAYGI